MDGASIFDRLRQRQTSGSLGLSYRWCLILCRTGPFFVALGCGLPVVSCKKGASCGFSNWGALLLRKGAKKVFFDRHS